MNDQQRAAMQMALEALLDNDTNTAFTALREALAEPVSKCAECLTDNGHQFHCSKAAKFQLNQLAEQAEPYSDVVSHWHYWQKKADEYRLELENLRAEQAEQEPVACEPVPPIYEDGWSDWICPKPKGYLMQCCDCGLIHEVDSRVAKYEPRPSEEFVVVNDQNMQSQWRMRRRDDLASSQQAERMIFQAREIGESEWFDVGLDETERINAYINSPHIDYRRLYAAPVSIEAAVLAEREACAKVCEELGYFHEVPQGSDLAFELAAAIRSMK